MMQFDTAPNSNWLPTFPTVAIRILDLFAKEDVAIVELANEIKLDPMLTAKLLNVANSPIYRSKREIATLEHAVSWLGKSEVAGLVLSFKMASFANENKRDAKYYNAFWRQSFVQGCAMQRIAECTGRVAAGEAYVCGLLMDFGMLLMLDGYPSGYTKIIEESRESGTPLHTVESHKLSITHSKIGMELLGNMGLPARFGKVAELHTSSLDELKEMQESDDDFDLIAAAVASAEIGDFYCRNNQAASLSNLEFICRNFLGMREGDLEWLLESVRNDINDKADLYQVDVEDMPSIGQLVGLANGQSKVGLNRVELGGDHGSVLQKENKLLRELIQSLEDRVCRDSLTGIFNRDYFVGRLNERINASKFVESTFGLVVIDIDDFKQINDLQGHLQGDQAINWTATFLKTCFEKDIVARFGGDEFMILVDKIEEEEFSDRLEKLCLDYRECSAASDEIKNNLKISVGGVFCQLNCPNSSLGIQLFDMADKAMYEAKRAGGSQSRVVTTSELPDSWKGSVDASSDLDKAPAVPIHALTDSNLVDRDTTPLPPTIPTFLPGSTPGNPTN